MVYKALATCVSGVILEEAFFTCPKLCILSLHRFRNRALYCVIGIYTYIDRLALADSVYSSYRGMHQFFFSIRSSINISLAVCCIITMNNFSTTPTRAAVTSFSFFFKFMYQFLRLYNVSTYFTANGILYESHADNRAVRLIYARELPLYIGIKKDWILIKKSHVIL